MSGLIEDLLTENRYWTFWSSDWSVRVNVYWGGETKFEEVKQKAKEAVLNKLTPFRGNTARLRGEVYYERQILLKNPDIIFK